MSVQERYSFEVSGVDEALAIAGLLAPNCGASLRWVALWTTEPRRDLVAYLESRPESLLCSSEEGVNVIGVPSPTADEVRYLIAQSGNASVCVHWRPGQDAPWVSFVDASGYTRDDARVYRIELTQNAVPFTTGDDPAAADFVFGPELSEGLRLQVQLVRDHMPREQLRAWLSRAACLPVDSVRPV